MKLRRRRKEEKEPHISCLTITQLARSQSPLPFSLLFSPSLFIISVLLFLHPAPPAYLLLRHPSLSAATCRESNVLQLCLPQLFRFSLSSS